MQYLNDPAPVQTAAPYDDSTLKAAIATLTANEGIDDATVAALETLVKAKDAAHDQAIAQLVARVDAIPTQTVSASKAEIEAIFDPLPAPSPIIAPVTMNGATLVSGVTGSQMVNGGKVHTFGRLSSPPAPNTWNGTLTISPVTGACKVRWAITTAIQGTIEVSIDGATPFTASNTGFGWSGATPAIAVYTDAGYTWFEVAIAQSSNTQSVKVTIPTGRGQIPCIYAANAITSLIPDQPTGLKLRAMPGGETLEYRPSTLALKTDIPAPTPPFDPTTLNNRIGDVEYGLSFVSNSIVAFSSEMNISTQLNATHPSGTLYKEFVTQNPGYAIDLTLGSNVTAATLKTELEVPATDTLIRIKAGIADAIIANASLIPAGLYRLWYSGGQIRMRVLDS